MLTEEGYLIVRDLYEPGKEVDGFQAGPVWCLRSDGKSEASPISRRQEQCWFDAPAWEHAWWQKRKKRVLVYIHPQDGQTYGQVQHETTPDISRTVRTDSSFARAIVRAGKPKVFLSMLVPHDAAVKAESIVGRIRTVLDRKGDATAEIGSVRISIGADGSWQVTR